jgi:hypothetical protein
MGKFFNQIQPQHRAFMEAQHIFFTATAPLSPDGRVNLSPKGLNAFRVLDEQTVGYMDLISSGNETSAHTKENGRITFMFCAFDDKPKDSRCPLSGDTARWIGIRSISWSESPQFRESKVLHAPFIFSKARQFFAAWLLSVAVVPSLH